MYFLPFLLVFFVFYILVLGLLFFIVQIGAIGYAFDAIGIPAQYVILLLFLSLVGSAVNIPVKTVSSEILVTRDTAVHFLGWRFRVPRMVRENRTLIAVNLGGAVIPVGLSLYLLITHPQVIFSAGIATLILVFAVNRMARVIQGVGIGVPLFLPPVIAALVAVLLTGTYAPVVAYISGTLGTLIGADLLNLRKIARSGAPVASIGGAGTFDGIFLTGIIAVLLASI